jgi:diacylglycerol kinase (ATP)
MKTLFIINPIAGKGKAKEMLPLIEEICKRQKIVYEIVYTTGPKDGIKLAKDGVLSGFQRIISVGGDGTLNEIVNGIAGSDVVLGVIPGGTGNDFIRSIYKDVAIERIVENAIIGTVKKIDLAKCNDTYFINIGSGGFDAQVALESEKTRKYFSGSTAYLVALLKMLVVYKGKKMKVTIDDMEFEKNTFLVAVANGKYYGGGILPAPMADMADGVFDICIVGIMTKLKMFRLFPRYMKGTHAGIKEVSFYRGKHIKLAAEEPFAVNVDGEVTLLKHAEFDIIPNGISISVEKESMV